ADGAFVVVWESGQAHDQGGNIFGQRYSSAGAPLGTEFQADTTIDHGDFVPAVATDSAGDFVVAWSHFYFVSDISGVHTDCSSLASMSPATAATAHRWGRTPRSIRWGNSPTSCCPPSPPPPLETSWWPGPATTTRSAITTCSASASGRSCPTRRARPRPRHRA